MSERTREEIYKEIEEMQKDPERIKRGNENAYNYLRYFLEPLFKRLEKEGLFNKVPDAQVKTEIDKND